MTETKDGPNNEKLSEKVFPEEPDSPTRGQVLAVYYAKHKEKSIPEDIIQEVLRDSKPESIFNLGITLRKWNELNGTKNAEEKSNLKDFILTAIAASYGSDDGNRSWFHRKTLLTRGAAEMAALEDNQ